MVLKETERGRQYINAKIIYCGTGSKITKNFPFPMIPVKRMKQSNDSELRNNKILNKRIIGNLVLKIEIKNENI